VAAVVAAYVPALEAGFVWNDDTYLTENPTLDGAQGLRLIWTEPRANEQYYPLVFTTFWVEKKLYGLHPFGYHLVNVLLHACSALLLFRLLRRLALPGAGFAAALFALHPLCVESVAWVTERKNTLSLFLSLVAMLLYFSYREALEAREARDAESRTKKKRRSVAKNTPWGERPSTLYGLALLAFTLALFAKTTASVVPAVLLVLVFWKRGRLRAEDVRPLVPFFAVGIALAFYTAWFERTTVQAAGEEWALGPLGRVVLAGRVFAFYLGKLLFPSRLAFIYSRFTVDPRAVWQWGPALAAIAALGVAFSLRNRLGRGPLVGLLLFGGVLFPAMGFFNVYAMRYSYVADHFAYQAVAVFAACLACGVATLVEGRASFLRWGAGVAGVAALALLGFLSFRQSRAYASEETLWRDTIEKSPDCFMCHTNYGFYLAGKERVDEAVAHFETSLRLKPDNVQALLNLAHVEEQRGRLDAAASRLRAALKVDPTDTTVLVNLATIHTKTGKYAEAVTEYEEALKVPFADDHVAHNGLGVALLGQGRVKEAIVEFQRALDTRPDYEGARANLERALAMARGPMASPRKP